MKIETGFRFLRVGFLLNDVGVISPVEDLIYRLADLDFVLILWLCWLILQTCGSTEDVCFLEASILGLLFACLEKFSLSLFDN